ncbi:class I SAM-dependent methyltransferase [Methanothrix thermoacetophila]|uniref:Methyltransferase type 11 n=1 Tax=Methanothrix thermoacetophila (strain DSM 6194 / JCM 14653 / NBRC 101360 / PT) TaxID=349307 RepID=A0B828_METTP|nr:methyltransferase domain-containing protein [Methanothrix thermoacetophila]ABK14852.1 Methyltransferase type 11 [Methanothrix thermoacetophila PT]
MLSLLRCPRCSGELESIHGSLCCSCGFSYLLRDDVHLIEGAGNHDTEYSEEYYRSSLYDLSEDRISKVVSLARILPGERVLDLGCGPGVVALRCSLLGAEVYAVDPSRAALMISAKRARDAGARIELFEFDGRSLPFKDSSFDTVIMADVAEHIDDGTLSTLLSECFRTLTPGGRLVLHTAPALEAMRAACLLRAISLGTADLQKHLVTPEYEHLHIRYHSRGSIRGFMRAAGLSPIVWGEVKYLKDKLPGFISRWIPDQIWAVGLKGRAPDPTFPEAPYLDLIDLPSEIDMLNCTEWAIGAGFYPCEGCFRWTERSAVLYLRSNEMKSHLKLDVAAARPDLSRRPLKLAVHLDGRKVGEFALSDPGRRSICFDLPTPISPGLHRVRLTVDRTFVPREWGNDDTRRLGIAVYRVGVI